MLAVSGKIPKLMSKKWYYIFTFLGLGSCYRTWFGRTAKIKKKYTFYKIIYCNFIINNPHNYNF